MSSRKVVMTNEETAELVARLSGKTAALLIWLRSRFSESLFLDQAFRKASKCIHPDICRSSRAHEAMAALSNAREEFVKSVPASPIGIRIEQTKEFEFTLHWEKIYHFGIEAYRYRVRHRSTPSDVWSVREVKKTGAVLTRVKRLTCVQVAAVIEGSHIVIDETRNWSKMITIRPKGIHSKKTDIQIRVIGTNHSSWLKATWKQPSAAPFMTHIRFWLHESNQYVITRSISSHAQAAVFEDLQLIPGFWYIVGILSDGKLTQSTRFEIINKPHLESMPATPTHFRLSSSSNDADGYCRIFVSWIDTNCIADHDYELQAKNIKTKQWLSIPLLTRSTQPHERFTDDSNRTKFFFKLGKKYPARQGRITCRLRCCRRVKDRSQPIFAASDWITTTVTIPTKQVDPPQSSKIFANKKAMTTANEAQQHDDFTSHAGLDPRDKSNHQQQQQQQQVVVEKKSAHHNHHQQGEEVDDNDDRNDDWCHYCGKYGQLLCCDDCHLSFHLQCCGLDKLPAQNEHWSCPVCAGHQEGTNDDMELAEDPHPAQQQREVESGVSQPASSSKLNEAQPCAHAARPCHDVCVDDNKTAEAKVENTSTSYTQVQAVNEKFDEAKEDSNDDWCFKCNRYGNLICCDQCFRAYHPRCAGLKFVPTDTVWACPVCQQSSDRATEETSHDAKISKKRGRRDSPCTTPTTHSEKETRRTNTKPAASVTTRSTTTVKEPGADTATSHPAPATRDSEQERRKRRISDERTMRKSFEPRERCWKLFTGGWYGATVIEIPLSPESCVRVVWDTAKKREAIVEIVPEDHFFAQIPSPPGAPVRTTEPSARAQAVITEELWRIAIAHSTPGHHRRGLAT